MEQQNKLLTIGQAAKMLGVTTTTLRVWDKSGELTALRVGTRRGGGDRRYRKENIENYLKKKMK
jgi:excisionase family DNA binding protein